MRLVVVLTTSLFLTACAKPVPVKMEFPLAPEILLKKCEELKQIEPKPGGVPINEIFKTIINNYTLYHECSNKVDGWNDWYKSMQKIYNEIGQ